MKPPAFVYHAPSTLDEALDVLAQVGGDGKVLAGGQSLVPLLNMRLAAPGHLVDINRIGELDTVEATPEGVRVGALARHARVERCDAAFAVQPLLRQALRLVAHPVVRNRGTVVGSIAHADPAAEMPAVLALLDGTVEVASRDRRRTVPAREFFVGPLESCLKPGEMAVSAFFPACPPHGGTAFVEVARRHGDYALVGVAARVVLDDDLRISSAKAAYISVDAVPLVLDLTDATDRRPPDNCDWSAVAAHARAQVEPEADIHASAEYRCHLAGVLTERALRAAAEQAQAARRARGPAPRATDEAGDAGRARGE